MRTDSDAGALLDPKSQATSLEIILGVNGHKT